MQLLTALMHIQPAYLVVAGLGFLALIANSATQADEDDNSDFENASWNPASVNYND